MVFKRRTILLSMLSSFLLIGCTYKSTDEFFAVKSIDWKNEFTKSIYVDSLGKIEIYNIDLSWQIDGEKKVIHENLSKDQMDIFISYSLRTKENKCDKNDIRIFVKREWVSPSYTYDMYRDINHNPPFWDCQYRFKINSKYVNKFKLKFQKLNIPEVELKKDKQYRKNYIPLS